MKDTQLKISEVIEQYKKQYKDEYLAFVRQQRHLWMNTTRFAALRGTDAIERGIKEVPETLFKLMKITLTDSEFEYYNSKEGSRWMVKRYPEFAMAEDV